MRRIPLAFTLASLFGAVHLASGATVVQSRFVYGGYLYSNRFNWWPQEVANNTVDKTYDVTVERDVYLDMDATVSNLTLSRQLSSYGPSFTVTGATTLSTNPDNGYWNIYLQVYPQNWDHPITCALGSLSTFADGILTGRYAMTGPATLQFNGANVVTLSHATVLLANTPSRIVDENGLDGLRNLARIEADSALTVGHSFFTFGNLTVDGSLSVQMLDAGSTMFSVTGALTNFDQPSRTLRSGSYAVIGTTGPATLRFSGADIVNNAATLSLSGSTSITDEKGQDGLRNFSHNLSTGRITTISQHFIRNGDFTNDGVMEVDGSSFAITGTLTNYDAASQTLNGGTYKINTWASATAQLSFAGADIVHNNASLTLGSSPAITDEKGEDALRHLTDNLADGTILTLVPFTFGSDFTNSGTMTFTQKTSVPVGHVYRQSAGRTMITGANFTGTMDIEGGMLGNATQPGSPHSGISSSPASITGSVTIGSAVFSPAQLSVTGDVALSTSSTLHYVTALPDSTIAGVNVSGKLTLSGKLEVEYSSSFPTASQSSYLIAKAGTLTGGFSNVTNGARITTTDGSGSFLFLITNQNQAILTNYQRAIPASQLMNISTRAKVLTGDNILIGGFIIYGTDPMQIVARAIGPSLANSDVSGALQDPVLELHDSKGALVMTNDNWQDTQETDLRLSGLAPTDARESALIKTLPPGAYTVVIRGKNNGTGVALVEIYDLSKDAKSKLANISTRGIVDNEQALIGGTIAGGNGHGNVELVVRALGEELRSQGFVEPNILIDPALAVYNADGAVVAANNNFGLPPENLNTIPRELSNVSSYDAVTGMVLPPGPYTVVVQAAYGSYGSTTNALVEMYDLNR